MLSRDLATVPTISTATARKLAACLFFLMGCLAVPIGGIAQIAVLYGELTPSITIPPPPSVFHMVSAVVLYFALRAVLGGGWICTIAMAMGVTTLSLTEAQLQAAFPHLWMRIYELVNFIC